MTTRDDQPITPQERDTMRHYDDMTVDFYLAQWNSRHIHFGLFKDEEVPREGAPFTFAGPESLTRGLERMVDAIVAPAGIGSHHHVMDAGCGVGGTVIYLATSRGCRATGVNMNEGQLEIARTRANEAGLTPGQIDFRRGNCSRRLPFDSESIDVVTSVESACHYSDRRQFLREVYRILKPGGQIAASDWLMSDDTSTEKYERYIKPMCEYWTLAGLESLSQLQEAVARGWLYRARMYRF